jgi:hypothetical protein
MMPDDSPLDALCDDDTLFLPGLEAALLGIATRCTQGPVAVYDYDALVRVFVERDGLTPEEAAEYIDFNIAGAWVGDRTPLLLVRVSPEAAP